MQFDADFMMNSDQNKSLFTGMKGMKGIAQALK